LNTCQKLADNPHEKELREKLRDFGLSEKEAAVYLALLPRRDVGSSKLSQASGLHRQFVYDALERLEELGLAKHAIQNGRKKFSANTPARLVSLIDEKKLAVQSVAKELQSRFAGGHEQEFEVFQGTNAFIAHQFDLLERAPEGSRFDIILAGPIDVFVKTLGPEADVYEEMRVKKNISVRFLAAESQRKDLEAMGKWRKLFEYKILTDYPLGVIATDIWWDHITFHIFGDPILDFTITSKEITDGYRGFFEGLWKLAK
jgi:sugar-specific transcriptional regulator TrmB